MKIVKFGYI